MRKRCLVLSILAGTLLLLLALAVVLLALVLDPTSPVRKSKGTDFLSMLSIMRKLNQEMTSIANAPPGIERTLTLTESEFNALAGSLFGNFFAASLPIRNNGKALLPKEWRNTLLELRDGIFHLTWTRDTGRKTPFGSCLNLFCRFTVRVENGILKWDILSFRIGDLPLPAALVRSYANRHFQRKFRGSPAETILAEGIVLLEADRTGNLVLRYRPRETVDAADRVCFGSANNRIRQFLNRYKK